MKLFVLAVLLLLITGIVNSRKVHLDLKDLGELKLSDLAELVKPAYNTISDAITLDNVKAGLKTAGNVLGQGADIAVKAYNEAGGVKGITETVVGKASDAYVSINELIKPDTPLTTNPNGEPPITPPTNAEKIPLKELA
jgi:hypothetical protein